MKLVVKQPKDKPPFIGICFTSEYEGAKLNNDLINEYKDATYKIVLEFKKDSMILKLYTEQYALIRFYRKLTTDNPDKLKTWLKQTQDIREINFGHIYQRDGIDTLVKTNKNIWFVLKIDSVAVVLDEDSSEEMY